MRCWAFIPCLSLLLLSSLFFSADSSAAAIFTCNVSANATCRGLAGYVVPNATTYDHIRSLFQVDSLASLLGANNKSLSTPATQPVPANSIIFVPFPCRCANDTGKSDGVPIYTVTANDSGLDAIARYTFDQFVNYTEIGDANNLPNYNITAGQKLYIPLPCSCDPVQGTTVAHLAHVVASGSTLSVIAEEFGTDVNTLLQLNGNFDPRTLQAGQTLDVPLKVCSSSIKSTSLDYDFMRLPGNSYALTANGCVQCSCNNDTYQLDCRLNQSMSSTECPAQRCAGDRQIGNTSTSGCETTTCDYAGYTNSSANRFQILATLTTNKTILCNTATSARLGPKVSKWTGLLMLLQMALIGSRFL